jgi:hypothetical protein
MKTTITQIEKCHTNLSEMLKVQITLFHPVNTFNGVDSFLFISYYLKKKKKNYSHYNNLIDVFQTN